MFAKKTRSKRTTKRSRNIWSILVAMIISIGCIIAIILRPQLIP